MEAKDRLLSNIERIKHPVVIGMDPAKEGGDESVAMVYNGPLRAGDFVGQNSLGYLVKVHDDIELLRNGGAIIGQVLATGDGYATVGMQGYEARVRDTEVRLDTGTDNPGPR